MASPIEVAGAVSPARAHLLSQAARVVERATGIRIPAYRWPMLEAELETRSGSPLPSAVERLSSDPDLLGRLLGAIAIPETFLFRHPGHYRELAALARQRFGSGRPCRVLSAGCSSGEEAWAAAAVLADAYPGRRDIKVEAWDLDPARLARAERGHFRQWAVRHGGMQGYERFFHRTSRGWAADSALHGCASFRVVNLVEGAIPAGPEFDAIFFRNVSLYWEAETARRVAEQLAGRLASDGLLFVGPADPVALDRTRWEVDVSGDGPVYRRRRTPVAPREVPAAAPPAPRPVAPRALPRLAARRRLPPRPSPPPQQPPPRKPALEVVRELADAGRYEEALACALGQDSPSPSERLLTGILLLNLDRAEEALGWIRQAVFLAPDEPESRRWLSLALERVGRTPEAERERRNAEELESSDDRLRADT